MEHSVKFKILRNTKECLNKFRRLRLREDKVSVIATVRAISSSVTSILSFDCTKNLPMRLTDSCWLALTPRGQRSGQKIIICNCSRYSQFGIVPTRLTPERLSIALSNGFEVAPCHPFRRVQTSSINSTSEFSTFTASNSVSRQALANGAATFRTSTYSTRLF